MSDPRRHAPATLRNREPILAELRRLLPPAGLVLEVASGTGEHAAFMVPHLPAGITWQPTDFDAGNLASIDAHAAESGGGRIRPALRLDAAAADWPVAAADAIYCCNMIHIAPWAAAQGLFAGARRILPAGAPLILYGPFKRDGWHSAASNARFDAGLKAENPAWGVRCLDSEVVPLATGHGFGLDEAIALPSNNMVVLFRHG